MQLLLIETTFSSITQFVDRLKGKEEAQVLTRRLNLVWLGVLTGLSTFLWWYSGYQLVLVIIRGITFNTHKGNSCLALNNLRSSE